ncbi:hypothetical protein NFI96_007215 [Prochilodus magdalenae]|nr:hypothetical protein NFI96_007215 [Prochilodus magdalenae]
MSPGPSSPGASSVPAGSPGPSYGGAAFNYNQLEGRFKQLQASTAKVSGYHVPHSAALAGGCNPVELWCHAGHGSELRDSTGAHVSPHPPQEKKEPFDGEPKAAYTPSPQPG